MGVTVSVTLGVLDGVTVEVLVDVGVTVRVMLGVLEGVTVEVGV